MSSLKKDKNIILLDYYQGAYGPTIRLDVQSLEALNRIRKIFLQLVESKQDTLNFSELDCVKVLGNFKLILICVPDTQELEKKLRLVTNGTTGPIFNWAMPSNGWKRAIGLVDGLLESESPGHQYLTQEGVDDAIVELAYME